MKKIALAFLGATLIGSSAATADPAVFVGISYTIGSNTVGITGKILTSDKEEKVVGAAGATYYFGAENPFGIDVSGGYTFSNAAVLVGYDFLRKNTQISAGWADIK